MNQISLYILLWKITKYSITHIDEEVFLRDYRHLALVILFADILMVQSFPSVRVGNIGVVWDVFQGLNPSPIIIG